MNRKEVERLVEEKARELFNIWCEGDSKFNEEYVLVQDDWRKLARHVLIAELEARKTELIDMIDQIEEIEGRFSADPIRDRIAALSEQIEGLKQETPQ